MYCRFVNPAAKRQFCLLNWEIMGDIKLILFHCPVQNFEAVSKDNT
jgi:hypothetical protein